MAGKATAFTVAVGGAERTPKPKPGRKGPFKFLRKDEGQRADMANQPYDEVDTPRRSHSALTKEQDFRRKVARDMQQGERDPFENATVALPKRPPPSKGPEEHEKASNRRASPPSAAHAADTGALDDAPSAAAPPPERVEEDPRTLAHTRRPGAPPLLEDSTEDEPYDEAADFQSTAQSRRPDTAAHAQQSDRDSRSSSVQQHQQQPARDDRPRGRSKLDILREAHAETFDNDAPRAARNERVMRRADSNPPAARQQRRFDDDPEVGGYPQQRAGQRGDARSRHHQPAHATEDLDDGYDNYFDRPAQRGGRGRHADPDPQPVAASRRSAADEELLAELERQQEEVREEKRKYQRMLAEGQRMRERAQKENDEALAELQADRDDFEQWVGEEKRLIRKERRQLDDQRRRQSDSTGAEREANKRLQEEVESMREALDKMSVDMREKDRAHRNEVDRLKRQVTDLQARNDELSEMVRGYQVSEAERAADERDERRSATRDREATGYRRTGNSARNRSPSLSDDEAPPSADDEDNDGGRGRHDRHAPRAAAVTSSRRDVQHESRQHTDTSHGVDARSPRTDTSAVRPTRAGAGSARRQQPADDSHRNVTGAANGQSFVVPSPDEFISDVVEPAPVEDIPGDSITARNVGNDGRSEQLFRSGKRVINFSNGTRKVVLQTGHVILHFCNGDVKRTFPSGKTTYWYAVAQTTHTQKPEGLQVFQFHSSQQTEKHFPDGRKEILYPEGVYKVIAPDGGETTYFPDGSVSTSGAGAQSRS